MSSSLITLAPRLVDSLYTEAMVLADEARAYFAADGLGAQQVAVADAVAFSCESLKVTTRLMHSIAWLLNHRVAEDNWLSTVRPGEEPMLGYTPPPDQASLIRLPKEAQQLIHASVDLYARIARLQDGLYGTARGERAQDNDNRPDVHRMIDRIRAAF